MDNLITGILIGAGTTIVGFLLTISWDIYKYNRDQNEKDKAVLRTLSLEISENKKTINQNEIAIEAELKVLDQNKSIISPLGLLNNNSWEFVKLNLPKKLINDSTALEFVSEISKLIREVNGIISSRENYRINNEAMSNYSTRIGLYDNLINSKQKELKTKLETDLPDIISV